MSDVYGNFYIKPSSQLAVFVNDVMRTTIYSFIKIFMNLVDLNLCRILKNHTLK